EMVPSMGPPAYADGDTTIANWSVKSLWRLQWGRRPTPTETLHPRRAAHEPDRSFNGAAGLRRRRRRAPCSRHRPATTTFNGAAGLRRRRLRGERAPAGRDHPSMGPPAYADGDTSFL